MTLEQFKSCIYDFFKTLPSNEVNIFIKKTETNAHKTFDEFIEYYYKYLYKKEKYSLRFFICLCFVFDKYIYCKWNCDFEKFYIKYLNKEIECLWKD